MSTTADIKYFQSRWSELVDAKPTTEDIPFNFLVPKIETYYRSKAFVSQVGINALIAASAPLFFLIEKIQALHQPPDLDKLRDDLIHEINAFEHQAQAQGYGSYMILAARYILCRWVDQTVLNKAWGENYQWRKIQLPDNHEPEQDNSFYLLINRCLQEPAVYIDLLELFYLCLSLGFQQSIHTTLEANYTRPTETAVRDCLFEVISKQRERFSKQLEIHTPIKNIQKSLSSRFLLRPGMAILALLFLVGSYLGLNARLETALNGMHTNINHKCLSVTSSKQSFGVPPT